MSRTIRVRAPEFSSIYRKVMTAVTFVRLTHARCYQRNI